MNPEAMGNDRPRYLAEAWAEGEIVYAYRLQVRHQREVETALAIQRSKLASKRFKIRELLSVKAAEQASGEWRLADMARHDYIDLVSEFISETLERRMALGFPAPQDSAVPSATPSEPRNQHPHER